MTRRRWKDPDHQPGVTFFQPQQAAPVDQGELGPCAQARRHAATTL